MDVSADRSCPSPRTSEAPKVAKLDVGTRSQHQRSVVRFRGDTKMRVEGRSLPVQARSLLVVSVL